MNKSDWDAMNAREKDALVAAKVMREEMAPFGRLIMLPYYTTSRNTLALVEEEIERWGLGWKYVELLLRSNFDFFQGRVTDKLVMAIRRADPDLCCYCAVKACEEQE